MDPPAPRWGFKRGAGQYPPPNGIARHGDRRAAWSEFVLLVNPQIALNRADNANGYDEQDFQAIASVMDEAFEAIFSDTRKIASFMRPVRVHETMMYDTKRYATVVNTPAPQVVNIVDPPPAPYDPPAAGHRAMRRKSRRQPAPYRIRPADYTNDRFNAQHVFAHTWHVDYEVGGKFRRLHAMLTYRVLHDSAFQVNVNPLDPNSFPYLFSTEFNRAARARVTNNPAAPGFAPDEYRYRIRRPIDVDAHRPGVYVSVVSGKSLYGLAEYNKKDQPAVRGRWTRRPEGYGSDGRGAVRDEGQLIWAPPPSGTASRPVAPQRSAAEALAAWERFGREGREL